MENTDNISTNSSVSQNSPFVMEYDKLIVSNVNEDTLNRLCVIGGLRTSSFRSVVWRIILKCLPIDRREWGDILFRSRRQYSSLKLKNITNPRDSSFSQDPQVNNPLADSDQCPWHRFFADGSLRDIILKDVERTFPEMEFFQNRDHRRIMSNILLVYAKENPFISYKQGMHEILAPLLFVLFCDGQAFSHAKERGELKFLRPVDQEVLDVLNDPDYLEHDTYGLFCEVMREVSSWYEEGPSDSSDPADPQPFRRVQDTTATSQLMSELMCIGSRLSDLDPELHGHLSTLDIPPQLYGIRWLRLLFGREFPMHDLLFLWDVIFSDRPIPRIVECIFVAMLVQIRELLLSSDYGGCLQYLMRYPPVVDVVSFVQLTLHLRAPKKNPRPKSVMMSNYAHLTVQGQSHPNKRNDSVMNLLDRTQQQKCGHNQKHVLERNTPKKAQKTPPTWEQEFHILEEQVAVLQRRLDERDIVASVASREIQQVIQEIPGAIEEAARQSLAERLGEVSHSLSVGTVLDSTRRMSFGGDGMSRGAGAMPGGLARELVAAGPVELAKEVRARGTPRLRRDNELKNVKMDRVLK